MVIVYTFAFTNITTDSGTSTLWNIYTNIRYSALYIYVCFEFQSLNSSTLRTRHIWLWGNKTFIDQDGSESEDEHNCLNMDLTKAYMCARLSSV